MTVKSRTADKAIANGAIADQATRPRPRDANGYELDQWGLPLIGPARARALKALGKPDPRTDPAAWQAQAATAPMTQDAATDAATDAQKD